MSSKSKKLIIIDGNALIHRSFHALPLTMTTKKGEIVNAIYGFTAVLIKAIREFKPDYIVLTLDKKGPTFRHKEYKEYKATRVKAPDELYAQIPRIKEIAKAFNIPILEKQGFEADDLIGTIVQKINGNIEKIIVTGDLDTLQLIDDYTRVYTMSRGLSDSVIYDKKTLQEKYGLTPDQIIDFKALRGDPSDNIPGVPGIGEKTATMLLTKFGTLENLYKELEKNSPKIKELKLRIVELLQKHKKEAFLSKKLATIKKDVPIEFDLEKAQWGHFDIDKIIKLFSQLEFKSLLPRLKEIANNNTQNNNINKFERDKNNFKYELIDNEEKFKNFIKKIKNVKEFSFDTETSSSDPLSANLLGISFSWEKGEAYYVKIKAKKEKSIGQLTLLPSKQITNSEQSLNWLKTLKEILEDPNIKKNGHNLKFDIRVIKQYNINVEPLNFDTMIASYLLNPGVRQHNLDALTFSELGFEKISKKDLLGRDKVAFDELDIKKLSIYSCEDADFTQRLVKKLKPKLKKQKLYKLFKEIEMPLIKVLAQMEDNGIKLDEAFLKKLSEETKNKLQKLQKEIWEMAGEVFNINSTQQLKNILFKKLKISTEGISKTKTGFSTAAGELEKLKDKHQIISLIQEYRELNKLLTTYIDALPKMVNKQTGRIHTSFNQTVTATGRLSSTDPNLQNIPVRTPLGKKIRRAFIAPTGKVLLSLDYSQIELRLAAHMSGDKKMIKAFKQGEDIHASTAAEIHGVKLDEVTPQMRREAKAINFGILYGQGPRGLAQTAGIPYEQAKNFIDEYFAAFPEIEKFIKKTIEKARKKGYTETLFGRRRYLPEINSSVIQVRKAAERMAINTPLQGSAADIIKIAMIQIHKFIQEKYKNNIKMLLQVHDELVFEVEGKIVLDVAKQIKNIMEKVIKLKVPLIADAKIGKNWEDMKKLF